MGKGARAITPLLVSNSTSSLWCKSEILGGPARRGERVCFLVLYTSVSLGSYRPEKEKKKAHAAHFTFARGSIHPRTDQVQSVLHYTEYLYGALAEGFVFSPLSFLHNYFVYGRKEARLQLLLPAGSY